MSHVHHLCHLNLSTIFRTIQPLPFKRTSKKAITIMENYDFDKIDKAEWVKLGFFYIFNDELRRWEFSGSKAGLNNFHKELLAYTESKEYLGLSEHIHLGPYAYLKIITWNSPFISNDGFYGRIEDLRKLATIFIQKLEATCENDCFNLDKEYSSNNEASLLVCIKDAGFDPSSLD